MTASRHRRRVRHAVPFAHFILLVPAALVRNHPDPRFIHPA